MDWSVILAITSLLYC